LIQQIDCLDSVHTQYISGSAAAGSVEIPAVADKQTFVITGAVNVNYWDGNIRRSVIAPATVNLVSTTLSWTPSGVDTIVLYLFMIEVI